MGVAIKNISVYLPKTEIDNKMLSERFGVSEEEIYKRTGIKKRYRTTRDVIGSDMAYLAAIKMFESGEVNKEDVECLVFVSEGYDYIAPMTSAILQDRLGLRKDILVFDLPNGCSGFTHSLSIVKSLIESKVASNVLVLYGDTPGLVSPEKDFALQTLFSDVGSAVFFTSSEETRIGKFVFGADGSGHKDLYVDYSGFRTPVDKGIIDEVGSDYSTGVMKMDGIRVFTFAIQYVPQLVMDILKSNEESFDDIDYFVFHQPSEIILKTIKKKLKIPDEKLIINLKDYGNTVASSIPIILKESIAKGLFKKGSKVLVAGFGIGFSMSGTIIYF